MALRPVITKAVIPAAGLGTRFLPASKAVPKEMLAVVDRPAMQYVVEEAVRAGLTDVLVITSAEKRAIEDHFDRLPALESVLAERHKDVELAEVRAAAGLASMHYVRQDEPLGLGHAVSLARHHVGDEPFAVLLADEFMAADADVLPAMIDIHGRRGGSVLALQEVSSEEIRRYGAAAPEPVDDEGVVRVTAVVEKPDPAEAPSNLAVMGRYVLDPAIFDALDRIEPGAGGELQLTDAIGMLIDGPGVYGHVFDHGRYDTGTLVDYLKVNVTVALDRPDLGPELGPWLAGEVARRGL